MSKHTKDSSAQTTKQMLDELDALMEQMLALPVTEPDATQPFPKAIVRGPTLAATLTLLEPPPVAPPPKPAPATPAKSVTAPPSTPESVADDAEEQADHPVLNPPHLSLSTPESEPEPETETEPEPQPEAIEQPKPLTNAVLPPSVMSRLEPLLAEVPDLALPVVTNWFYLPLVWLNELFDSLTSSVWGTGWMRGPGGRLFLGFSGLTFLLIAIGWALVDWKGWNW